MSHSITISVTLREGAEPCWTVIGRTDENNRVIAYARCRELPAALRFAADLFDIQKGGVECQSAATANNGGSA